MNTKRPWRQQKLLRKLQKGKDAGLFGLYLSWESPTVGTAEGRSSRDVFGGHWGDVAGKDVGFRVRET